MKYVLAVTYALMILATNYGDGGVPFEPARVLGLLATGGVLAGS